MPSCPGFRSRVPSTSRSVLLENTLYTHSTPCHTMPVDLTFHKICSLPKLQASLSTTWWSLAKGRNWANSRKTLDSVVFCGGQQLRIPHDHSKRRENRSLCRFFRPWPAMNFITLDEIWSLVSKRPVAHTNGTKEPPHRTLFAPFRWQTEQGAELRDKKCEITRAK